MTASLVLPLLDSVFTVEGPAALLEEVAALFPLPTAGAGRRRHLVVAGLDVLVDDEVVQTSPTKPRLVEFVLMALNSTAIADVQHFAVHAGVVAGPAGAIAWPGVSGAGKSTLVAAALRAGFDYVSDEALVLDEGRACPYLKPLGLDAWSLRSVGLSPEVGEAVERLVPFDELGAAAVPAPVPVRHVVVLDRRPGPSALQPASPAAAAMLLIEHSFNHYKQPVVSFAAATSVARDASCWTLGYDSPADGAALLRELV